MGVFCVAGVPVVYITLQRTSSRILSPVEHTLSPQVTVWCGVTHDRIIGLSSLRIPTAATVNGNRCRYTLQTVVKLQTDQGCQTLSSKKCQNA